MLSIPSFVPVYIQPFIYWFVDLSKVSSRSATRDCGVVDGGDVDGVVDGGGGGVSGKHQVKFAEIIQFHFSGETFPLHVRLQPNH